MLDQTHNAPHLFPPASPTLPAQAAPGGDETLAVDLTIIAAGLRISRGAVFRASAGAPIRLGAGERRERLARLQSLWAAGISSVIDEGLLCDAVRRRPFEARLLAFEIAGGRAAMAEEIDRIFRLSAPAQLYR